MDFHAKNLALKLSNCEFCGMSRFGLNGSDFQYQREISEIIASKDCQNLSETP